jgi:hypothetical protein
MRHVADDRLSALVHRDVLHRDLLLASGSVSLECLYLRCEGPGEFVEGALRAILLRDISRMLEPTRECHGRHMNGGHLRRKHGFHLVFWLYPFDHRQHEIKLALVHFSALCPSIGELSDKYGGAPAMIALFAKCGRGWLLEAVASLLASIVG